MSLKLDNITKRKAIKHGAYGKLIPSNRNKNSILKINLRLALANFDAQRQTLRDRTKA